MRSAATDRLSALLLVALLAACEEAPPGETAFPGAALARTQAEPPPVELVTPFEEDSGQQAPAQEEAELADERLASARPAAALPSTASWTPPTYVPPRSGRATGARAGGRAGGGGRGAGGTAAATAAPTEGRERGAPAGGVHQGPTGGKRPMKNNPAITATEVPEQKAKKKYSAPYKGLKVRNPEKKGGGQ
jgi:hypothetical protein